MAVELRCPQCKAKLRLRDEPDPGEEVECPKCDHAFPWEPPAAADAPRKKKSADDAPKAKDKGAAADEPDGKGEADGKKEKAADKPAEKKAKGPKKRKAKKKKTPPLVIAGIVVGALMVVGMVTGTLIWYLTKKSSSQEMMSYLPDVTDEVVGVNLGHLRKYPGFYETCKSQITPTGFHAAGEAFAKALGQEFDTTIEYVVQGTGSATVLRAAAEFDPGVVAKLKGAKPTAHPSGVTYYALPEQDHPGLAGKLGYTGVRVFAPTNRLVVFFDAALPNAALQSMLTGNREAPDKGVYARSGALGKATVRGTVWRFTLYGGRQGYTPPAGPGAPASGSTDDADFQFKREVSGLLASAQGSAVKASVGSREVRGEWLIWYKDKDAASEARKNWKEKPWVKDDEEPPPRYWKPMSYKSGLGKTAENVIRDGLAFRASGELFVIRTEAETKMLQTGVGSLVSQFLDRKTE